MNALDLLFGTGNAIRAIFMLGYVPDESEFYELTYEQYQQYFETFGHTSEKVFMLIPNERKEYRRFAADEVFCMTESEKNSLKNGAAMIEKYCKDSDEQFKSYEDKLRYVASRLPPVFSEDSRYAIKS